MRPHIVIAYYKIKASDINMLSSFHGFSFENEDLYKHVNEFLDVCVVVRISDVDDVAMRLCLFFLS